MDVDVIHYHEGFDECAGSRRCPATNHVGFDPPNQRQAAGNFGFDHHKSESLFYRYYMTGDRWPLRVATGLVNWAYKSEDQPARRNFAHQMNSLMAAWWHTGDDKWLERGKKLLGAMRKKHARGWPKGDFYNGLMMEAIAKYYYASGDKTALESLCSYCDHHIANGFKFSNMTYGYSVAWQETGKKKYLVAALANINHGQVGHVGKDWPMHHRSTAYSTGILAAAVDHVE
jgi:rhamnogalacturonyl hydrolase YesR